MSNPFNAPPHIADLLEWPHMGFPLLKEVMRLGPKRVQWIGRPENSGAYGALSTPTCWSLDGKRASLKELRKAK